MCLQSPERSGRTSLSSLAKSDVRRKQAEVVPAEVVAAKEASVGLVKVKVVVAQEMEEAMGEVEQLAEVEREASQEEVTVAEHMVGVERAGA